MALCRAVKDYFKEGGATNGEIDDFLDFCSMFSKGKNQLGTSVTACRQDYFVIVELNSRNMIVLISINVWKYVLRLFLRGK